MRYIVTVPLRRDLNPVEQSALGASYTASGTGPAVCTMRLTATSHAMAAATTVAHLTGLLGRDALDDVITVTQPATWAGHNTDPNTGEPTGLHPGVTEPPAPPAPPVLVSRP